MSDDLERAKQMVNAGANVSYPSLGASREIRSILAGVVGRAEIYRVALQEIAKDSYLDEWELEFKPTNAALLARNALALFPATVDDEPCHGPDDTTCPSCGLGTPRVSFRGVLMCRPVLILCDACGSEGRIYRGLYEDERDCGECPVCEGTGSVLVESDPVTLEDLE